LAEFFADPCSDDLAVSADNQPRHLPLDTLMPDRVDEFESLFKRAAKERFRYDRPAISRIVLVTDLDQNSSQSLLRKVRKYLAILDGDLVSWIILVGDEYDRKSSLLDKILDLQCDLVITYRNLKQTDKNTPSSLGAYLDTLAQAVSIPVLVLPDEKHWDDQKCMQDTSTVMVMTNHLVSDNRLINYAVRFTQVGGTVQLCHIEDGAVFQYYMSVIEKIPSIESSEARAKIREQLLKQPEDYMGSCIEVLVDHNITARPEAHVLMGRALEEYRRLLDQYQADLLVFHTKDEDQLAMHGMAYALAIEFRHCPLLML